MVSILITRAVNFPLDWLAISSLLSYLPVVLYSSFILALFLCWGPLIRGQILRYSPRQGKPSCCAGTLPVGKGQRGNSAGCLLNCSALSKEFSCETGSFSHCGNHCVLQSALSLSFPINQPLPCSLPLCCRHPHPQGPLPHSGLSEFGDSQVWFFCLTLSSVLWFSEFHAV